MKFGIGISINRIAVGRLGPSPPPPAPTCSIALTGAYAAGFGLQQADINGQTFSVTNGDGGYLASTDILAPTPAWTGRRLIEMHNATTNGLANIRAGYALPDGSLGVFFKVNSDNTKQFIIEQPVGTPTQTFNLPSVVSAGGIIIDFPSGDVYLTSNGIVIGAGVAAAGLFSGQSAVVVVGVIESAPTGSASMTINTTISGMQGNYSVNGLQDLCGNTMPYWTPDNLGFQTTIADASVSNSVWQDTARTLSANTNLDPIQVMDNLSTSPGGGLLQSDTTNRTRRKNDKEWERVSGSQRLQLNDTLSIPDGFTVAFDCFTGTGNSQFLGGDNAHLRLHRATTTLVVYAGSGVSFPQFSNAIESNVRRRLVLTMDASGGSLYSEGQLLGTFTPGASTTVFNQVVFGTASGDASSEVVSAYGRIAVLKGKVNESQANALLGWLINV